MLTFLPGGETSFTLTPPASDISVTWSRQADGQWHAVNASGEDLGNWSYSQKAVTIHKGASTTTQSIAAFLNIPTLVPGAKGYTVAFPQPSNAISIAGQGIRVENFKLPLITLTPETKGGVLKEELKIHLGVDSHLNKSQ